jgi:hypothetical protein
MSALPDGVFRALLSLLTGGAASVWLVHDAVSLARLPRSERARRDPLVRDKRFGYAMGIVIASVGVVGTLRFNGIF